MSQRPLNRLPLVMAIAAASGFTSTAAFAADPCVAGTTYTVTTEAGDTSDGSLRAAIILANGNAGCDAIDFDPGVSSIILDAETAITESVNILGHGSDTLSISLPGGSPITSTANYGNIYVSDVTIENSGTGINVAPVSYAGEQFTVADSVIRNNSVRGIYALNTNVELNNVTISGHTQGRAAWLDITAIAGTTGTVTITGSSFINNTNSGALSGGAAYINIGAPLNTATITSSQFAGNGSTTTADGGALALNLTNFGSDTGNFRLENNTFSDNTAVNGGAVSTNHGGSGGTLVLISRQNTYSENRATGQGGALWVNDIALGQLSEVAVESSTIVDNSAGTSGGGIYGSNNANVTVRNTVVAQNENDGDNQNNIGGWLSSMDYSWVGDNGTLAFVIKAGAGTGNTFPGDESTLSFGSLRDNGGDTYTIAIGASSPLRDSGDPSAVEGSASGQILAEDQRGGTRVLNTTLDIGAFEFNPGADPDEPIVESDEDSRRRKSSGSTGLLTLLMMGLIGRRRRR